MTNNSSACLWSTFTKRTFRKSGDGEAVLPPHELPEQSEGEGSIPGIQILTRNPDQGELGLLFAQLHCVVAVLQLEHRIAAFKNPESLKLYIKTFNRSSSKDPRSYTFFMLLPSLG